MSREMHLRKNELIIVSRDCVIIMLTLLPRRGPCDVETIKQNTALSFAYQQPILAFILVQFLSDDYIVT